MVKMITIIPYDQNDYRHPLRSKLLSSSFMIKIIIIVLYDLWEIGLRLQETRSFVQVVKWYKHHHHQHLTHCETIQITSSKKYLWYKHHHHHNLIHCETIQAAKIFVKWCKHHHVPAPHTLWKNISSKDICEMIEAPAPALATQTL